MVRAKGALLALKFVLTLALTCILSPRGEDLTQSAFYDSVASAQPSRGYSKSADERFLLLLGEKAGMREDVQSI